MLKTLLKATVFAATLAVSAGAFHAPAFADTVYNRGSAAEPESLDPHKTSTIYEADILRDLFQGLVMQDAKANVVPGAAESWTVSDDGLTWRLRVRPGARFHSGDPCDAEAVGRALQKCRWSEDWSRQLWYWDPVDEVRPTGDEVVITLRHPCVRLPSLLWGMQFLPAASTSPSLRTRVVGASSPSSRACACCSSA